MNKWPNWFPGLALGVEHLVGLEDYLLARTNVSDQSDHGVEFLDWQASVTLAEDRRKISVHGLVKGITPGGLPVVVQANTFETAPLDVPAEGELVVDLGIEIQADHPEARLRVAATVTTADADAIPSDKPNTLYLGRFRFGSSSNKEILKWPLVLRLSAIEPYDEAWQRWVAPFTSHLADVLERLEKEAELGNRRAASSASSLTEVAFDWPHWNLAQLERRLRYASWLTSGPTVKMVAASSVLRFQPFPPSEVNGDRVPVLLASSLTLPRISKALPDLLSELLDPIDLRTPTSEFSTWHEHLNSPGGERNINVIAKSLRHRLQNGKELDRWSRTVGLITMARLGNGSAQEWPADVIRGYLANPRNSLGTEVADSLQKLYRNEAQKALSGPLGFYWLARAAQVAVSSIPQNEELLQYFKLMSVNVVSLGRQGLGDRVMRFLEQRIRSTAQLNQKETTAAKAGRWKRTENGKPGIPELRINVFGPKGSGKSALIKKYISLLGAGLAVQGTSGANSDNRPAGNADQESVVACELDGTTVAFRFIESRVESGHDISSPLDSKPIINESQGAILVIDAESLDVVTEPEALLRSFVQACGMLRKRGLFHALIVYSKSDEYGVVEPDVVRVLGDVAKYSEEKAWQGFVERATSTGSDESWNETRKEVLKQSRELWTELSAESGVTVGGYFVAAEPFDSSATFGVIESLNGLCEHAVKNVIPWLH